MLTFGKYSKTNNAYVEMKVTFEPIGDRLPGYTVIGTENAYLFAEDNALCESTTAKVLALDKARKAYTDSPSDDKQARIDKLEKELKDLRSQRKAFDAYYSKHVHKDDNGNMIDFTHADFVVVMAFIPKYGKLTALKGSTLECYKDCTSYLATFRDDAVWDDDRKKAFTAVKASVTTASKEYLDLKGITSKDVTAFLRSLRTGSIGNETRKDGSKGIGLQKDSKSFFMGLFAKHIIYVAEGSKDFATKSTGKKEKLFQI